MIENRPQRPPMDEIGMCRFCRRFDNHSHDFTNGRYVHGWYSLGTITFTNTTFVNDGSRPIGEEIWP